MASGLQVPLAMLFRLLAVLAIGGMIHRHHLRVTEEGQRPILMSEVRAFIPDAHTLRLHTGSGGGLEVVGAGGDFLGTVCRSMPHCRGIKGYSGPTDVLMAYGADEKLRGIAIRHSYDTPSHVEDVVDNYLFMERWNGKGREEIAGMSDLKASKVYGVSGATRTSEAVARSLALRAAVGFDSASADTLVFRWQDAALIIVAGLGTLLAFSKNKIVQRRSLALRVLIVIYLGLISGDLLAQSLLVSWAQHGVPWREVPGLVVLAIVAFVVPWSTGKGAYCTQICPHGQLQRWLIKWVPSKWRWKLGADSKWGLLALPGALLVVVLLVTFLRLEWDLAGIEPFDAWSWKNAGIATLVVAGLSLVFSAFVPMGYCRYACPTGLAMNLVRKSRKGFVARDGWLLGLVILTVALYFGYETWKPWVGG